MHITRTSRWQLLLYGMMWPSRRRPQSLDSGDEKALPSSGRIKSACRDVSQKKNGMHECFRIAVLKLERSGTETERHEGAFLVLGLDRLALVNTPANQVLLDVPLQGELRLQSVIEVEEVISHSRLETALCICEGICYE